MLLPGSYFFSVMPGGCLGLVHLSGLVHFTSVDEGFIIQFDRLAPASSHFGTIAVSACDILHHTTPNTANA